MMMMKHLMRIISPPSSIIVIVFIAIISISSLVESSQYLLSKKSGCSEKDQRRIDEIASRFYAPGPNAPYFPTNYQELRPFCREIRNVSKTIETFMLRCFTKEVVQYAKIMFYTVNRQMRNYCSKRTKRLTKLLKLAPCINRHLRTETICIDNWLRDFSRIQDLENDKDKIIHGCCLTADVYICFDDLIEKYECSRKNRFEIMDFLTNISSDLQTVCGEYTHQTDACDTKKPKLKFHANSTSTNGGKNSLDRITRRQNALRFKTPMFVLIDLLDSFADPDSIIG